MSDGTIWGYEFAEDYENLDRVLYLFALWLFLLTIFCIYMLIVVSSHHGGGI